VQDDLDVDELVEDEASSQPEPAPKAAQAREEPAPKAAQAREEPAQGLSPRQQRLAKAGQAKYRIGGSYRL